MDLIEAAKGKLGSYRAVAKHLRVHETFISGVRAGRKTLPAFQAAKLAELLERNPAQAYVEAEILNAGKDEAASLRRWFKSVAATIAVAFVAVGLSGFWTSPASAWNGFTGSANPSGKVERVYSMRTYSKRERSAREHNAACADSRTESLN